jgi:hypothetical protein
MADHFIIGGAQRSGTSFLVRALDRHPAIEFARPLRPEPKFFLRPESARATLADYQALFPAPRGAAWALRGEKSTSYLDRVEAAPRIRRLLPAATLVFVLRDPVERALSHFRFSVEHGVETATMEEAFLREPERRDRYDAARFSVSPFAYVSRGCYEPRLRGWEEHFSGDRLILLLFEDLARDPDAVVRRLIGRLGADATELDDLPPSEPEDDRAREDALTPELRRFLVEIYREPNRRLAERYGLDLSRWQGGSAAAARPVASEAPPS